MLTVQFFKRVKVSGSVAQCAVYLGDVDSDGGNLARFLLMINQSHVFSIVADPFVLLDQILEKSVQLVPNITLHVVNFFYLFDEDIMIIVPIVDLNFVL